MNKLKWKFNKNTQLFIHENAYENIVCEMTAILSRGDELKFVACLGNNITMLISCQWVDILSTQLDSEHGMFWVEFSW